MTFESRRRLAQEQNMVRVVWTLVKSGLLVALVGSSFAAGWATGRTSGATGLPALQVLERGVTGAVKNEAPPPRQFKLLNEIWDIIQQDYVDPSAVDPDKIGRGAIDGVVQALGDAHTTYIDKEQYAIEQSGIRGSYEGIGAHVALQDGAVVIVSPIIGSPAEEAGVHAGDRILEVNGESIQGLSLTEVVDRIKGPRGTTVALTLARDGAPDNVILKITRAEIKTGTVFPRMLGGGIAYIAISQFSQRTGAEMKDALTDLKKQGMTGLVLDLRNNPGGLLDTTVETASQFLDKGTVAVQVNRSGDRETWEVRPGGVALDTPMVVLVNQGSASGSEVLTGALQDRGRATVIGTRTFGKGSVNHIRELSDGSAFYVTIARWLTPNGRLIEGKGLEPDVPVNLTDDDIKAQRDPQLDKALEVLKQKVAAQGAPAAQAAQ